MNMSEFNCYKLFAYDVHISDRLDVNKTYIIITYICVTDFISQQLIHSTVTVLLQVRNRINRFIANLSHICQGFFVYGYIRTLRNT